MFVSLERKEASPDASAKGWPVAYAVGGFAEAITDEEHRLIQLRLTWKSPFVLGVLLLRARLGL